MWLCTVFEAYEAIVDEVNLNTFTEVKPYVDNLSVKMQYAFYICRMKKFSKQHNYVWNDSD